MSMVFLGVKTDEQVADETDRLLTNLDLAIKMAIRTSKDKHGAYWPAESGVRFALAYTTGRFHMLNLDRP